MKSTRYSFPILIRCEYCRQTFEKYPNIKFYENPSSGATCSMRTDVQSVRNDEAFRNFANAPENKGQKDGSRLSAIRVISGITTRMSVKCGVQPEVSL